MAKAEADAKIADAEKKKAMSEEKKGVPLPLFSIANSAVCRLRLSFFCHYDFVAAQELAKAKAEILIAAEATRRMENGGGNFTGKENNDKQMSSFDQVVLCL